MDTKVEQKNKQIQLIHLGPNHVDSNILKGLEQSRKAVRYRDAYQISCAGGEAWLFDYNVLVCWELKEKELNDLCLEISSKPLTSERMNFSEQYRYRISPDEEYEIQNDLLVIPSDDHFSRLALSHAFAQSIKLNYFEEKVLNLITDNSHITSQLAEQGKVKMSRKELSKLRGRLFMAVSDVRLNFGLLDTPEFFWDFPKLEPYYTKLSSYLEINPRLEILNAKLTTLHEFLDMLTSEQHHKHSAFLEWIIIVLIAVDILIYFF